jgi:uncharacterized membrane protein SirB2
MIVLLKQLHVSFVAVSLVGFSVRGVWMLMDSDLLQRTWVKIAPHFIDTLLLVTGVWLVVQTYQYPWDHPWLAAKLVALVAYIVLGSIALRRGRTRGIRATALVGALAVFGYMVAVAVTRSATLSLG